MLGQGWERNDMKLAGKIAIVTGASRGLGKAIAIELARAGALVGVAARTVKAGQSSLSGTIHETVKEIEKQGGKAIAVRCDVSEQQDVVDLVEQINDQYGPVDILVNNAGIINDNFFLDLSTENWDLVMATNLRGTFLCTKAVLPQMVERRSGSVINLSSVLAKRIRFNISYGTSKAAIGRFTLGLAREMKKYNIAVNALAPDFTITETVTTLLPELDTTGWQLPEMWGKYTVLVAAQDAQSLTGRILDEPALKEIFGSV